MATYNKFQQFVEDIAHGAHDLETDQITVALSNVAPVATNTVIANITEIAYTNCSSRSATTSASAQTSGTYELTLADLTLTASGGTVGPFRYVVIYNSTQTTPLGPLIGWYDYGSEITLNDGESFQVNFDDVNGLLQIT